MSSLVRRTNRTILKIPLWNSRLHINPFDTRPTVKHQTLSQYPSTHGKYHQDTASTCNRYFTILITTYFPRISLENEVKNIFGNPISRCMLLSKSTNTIPADSELKKKKLLRKKEISWDQAIYFAISVAGSILRSINTSKGAPAQPLEIFLIIEKFMINLIKTIEISGKNPAHVVFLAWKHRKRVTDRTYCGTAFYFWQLQSAWLKLKSRWQSPDYFTGNYFLWGFKFQSHK